MQKKSSMRGQFAAFIFLFTVFYALCTAFFGINILIADRSLPAFLDCLPFIWYIKLIIAGGLSFLLIYCGTSLKIASSTVGDGQHGNARWANAEEKKKAYKSVALGKEKEPGIIVGFENGHWLVDVSDGTAMMTAPPGAGKTKCELIPTIEYNSRVNRNTRGKGSSLILTDSKGELLRTAGQALLDAGYNILYLDFRNPLYSYRFNLMHSVNVAIDLYKSANNKQDKILHYAAAERYAKIAASSIVDNMESTSRDETSQYFTETSKGLVTGLILLVSEYGAENERHIISVFKLIIELNGLDENSTNDLQKNKLDELLKHVDNDRIVNFAGASMKADAKTSMNIFSSALGKLVSFIDAELEQLICGHSPELNSRDFIRKPTAIFLICPDENMTRHFFVSLFIRNLLNELIADAEENNGVLPRTVLNLWDEWGNMPAIKDIDTLFTAARSRGIRSLVALQSLGQLDQRYNKTKAQIIKDSCQLVIFTYVAPIARPTAEEFSKALGDRTVQTGSISRNERSGSSTTLSMVRKPLLSPDEIIHMPWGNFVIMKAGCRPIQTKLPVYYDYLPKMKQFEPHQEMNEIMEIEFLTGDKIRRKSVFKGYELTVGMFD